MSHDFLALGMSSEIMPESIPLMYAHLCGAYDEDHIKAGPLDAQSVYTNMCYIWRQSGQVRKRDLSISMTLCVTLLLSLQEANQWHFHWLSSLIGYPVIAIYPLLDVHKRDIGSNRSMRRVYNRTIYGQGSLDRHPLIAIHWMRTNRDQGGPNHFCPVVP